MIIANNISNVNYNQIIYCNIMRNNIINGFFTKINYTTEFVVLNGLYITLPICTTIYNNNKIKFDPTCNHNFKLINEFSTLENDILNKYIKYKNININKKQILLLQLQTGFMKVYTDVAEYNNTFLEYNSHKRLVIKISGIWETSTECGITYKLFDGNNM